MIYKGTLVIPAGTPADSPETEIVSLCNGRIKSVRLVFPAGQAGLTCVQVWHHERQIYPTTSGEYFTGDDNVIEFPDSYDVSELPCEVELRGWSPDATLEHTVYVSFAVEVLVARSQQVAVYVSLPEGM